MRRLAPRLAELSLWALACVLGAAGVLDWRAVRVPGPAAAATIPAAPPTLRIVDLDSLARGAEQVAAANPFRLERRPSDVRYSPELEGAPPPAPPPAPPRPPLVLKGILGGPPWEAILEGIPGRQGSVVARAGERLGDLLVKSVGRDTVTVVGADTTWKLTVKRAWQ